ncbi:hypothetical protein HPB47_005775, partial [Ixodes persulcatus]
TSAYKLITVQSLTMGDKTYATHTYVAAPHGSTKAVVHGIKPNTPPAKLMEDLQAKGYDILSARMPGGSKTALVTLRGRKIPQYVKYICSYVECNHPYLKTGHRADMCPAPANLVCPRCTTPNPKPGHQCSPKCLQCGGDHMTGDKTCSERFETRRPPARRPHQHQRQRQAWKGERQRSGSRPRDEQHQQQQQQQRQARQRERSTSQHQPVATLELLPEPVTRKDVQNTCCARQSSANWQRDKQEQHQQQQLDRAPGVRQEHLYGNYQHDNKDPEEDRHLLHLWEARHDLTKRWKRQKLNRKLKKLIAAITGEALKYATQLALSNWNKKCTDLQGNLGTRDTWQILRQLLDPSKSIRITSQTPQKILRDFPGTNQDLLEHLKQRYIGSSPDKEYHDNEGEPNPDIDRSRTRFRRQSTRFNGIYAKAVKSAVKSELILVCKTPRSHRKLEPRDEIHIFLDDGSQIPVVPRARILGSHLQVDGKATHTLTLLQNQVTQILRIMHREPAGGTASGKTIRSNWLTPWCCRASSTPHCYLNLTKEDEVKLDVLIRKAYKDALGLPPYTSTEKLLKLGVHNTFRELADCHLATRRDRLTQTPAGERSSSRSRFPSNGIERTPRHRFRGTFRAKSRTGSTRVMASLRTSNTTIAEELAIAMAIGLGEDDVTSMSGSQAALRRFLAGRVSPKALKVLTQKCRKGSPRRNSNGSQDTTRDQSNMSSANFGWDISDILPQRDPRTKEWMLVGNKSFLVTLIAGYVYLVKIAGPRFMKRRQPYEGLKPFILLHNLFMVVANAYFAINFLSRSYLGGGYNIVCQGIDFEAGDKVTMEYLELCWWSHWVRKADLLDTIFFVLRKKDSHVSFLHVFHHGAVLFGGWYALAYGADGQLALGICVNSFVHVVMHSYYFLSLLGPAFRPYLWWKRHLTQLQLLQFGIMFIHGLIPLFIDCGYPRFHVVLGMFQLVVITVLFLHFYAMAYLRQSGLSDKAQ